MRGLDTNVLLRYLADDDPVQSAFVRDLFGEAEERQERFYVSTILLCELSWTLRGKPYSLDRSAIAEVIAGILVTRLFEVQDRDLVHRAVADFQEGRADFPDYLLGYYNQRAGCGDTVSFDRKLRGQGGFSLLVP